MAFTPPHFFAILINMDESGQTYIDSIWDLELSVLGHAESWGQLKQSFQSILSVIAKQAEKEDPYFQVAIISAAFRKVTRKSGELLLKKEFRGKLTENDFAWLSFGGEARREVTLKFDQDNGIVLLRKSSEAVKFAEEMVDRLAWLRLSRCQGGVMASNPEWQGDVDTWLRRIENLLSGSIDETELRRLSVLLDIDFVFGNRSLYEYLINKIKEKYPKSSSAKRMLARDIIDIPKYTTIFGNLALETRHDRRGKFNFKFACLYPFVGVVRLEAWDKGISVASTKHRLRFLYERGYLTEGEYQDRNEILKEILHLRLTQQRRQLEKGTELSDYFDLNLFNKNEIKRLKRVVKKVEKLKNRLLWVYWS